MNTSDKLAAVLDVIQGIKGVSFVGVDLLTVVPLQGGKKNPMLDRVTKMTVGIQAMVCRSNEYGSPAYENAVNRRLEKEGKPQGFNSKGLADWAEIVDFPVFKHRDNDTHYLQLICMNSGKSEYFLDGHPIAKADIIGFKPEKVMTGQGGLSEESEVIVRSPKIESIDSIRIMGETIE